MWLLSRNIVKMWTFGFKCYLGWVLLCGWWCELFYGKEECFVSNLGATLWLMELLFKLIFMCVKSRGVNIWIYMIYRVSSLWDISMSKLGEIFH